MVVINQLCVSFISRHLFDIENNQSKMPTVKDPRKLTIAKLKEELLRYDVELPPSGSKKQVYIDLYTKNISDINDPEVFKEELDRSEEFSETETEGSEENETVAEEESKV